MSFKEKDIGSDKLGNETTDDSEAVVTDMSKVSVKNNEDSEELHNEPVNSDTKDISSDEFQSGDEKEDDAFGTPTGVAEEPLLDDLVDEEKLKEEEASLTEEELTVVN